MRQGYRTPWLQEAYVQGKAEGKVEGKAEGKAQGKAEGKLEGYRSVLFKVLAVKRFELSPELRRRIETTHDLELFESWLEATTEAKSLSEIFKDS